MSTAVFSSFNPTSDKPLLGRSMEREQLPHIVGEEVFRDALVRERRRSDRSNQPLLLFLVTVGSDPRLASAVIARLTTAKRETDVLGWYERESVVGVIVPDIISPDGSILRSIVTRLKNALNRGLSPAALSAIAVEVHVHSPFKNTADFKPVDQLIARPQPRAARVVMKRTLDIVGGAALLAILSPVMMIIGALIKLTSKGPVFFRQVRVGRQEQPFKMLKFRTMRVDVDHKLHQEFVTRFIRASGNLGEVGANPEVAPFKIANDPRITPIGQFLRRTSLDELPQFLNVLRGEMSLVGPRPPLPYEVEQYQPWHCRRVLEATPGITGLWQVAGRSRTTFDEMVRLDLRYARDCSLLTDLKILFATPAAVIRGKGAV